MQEWNVTGNNEINLGLSDQENFIPRHIGPNDQQIEVMLNHIGLSSLDELIEKSVPNSIRMKSELNLEKGLSENDVLNRARALAKKNLTYRSLIGMGYYDCLTPTVILRNILENPGWYTAYTPYQAEISQGRMEALLNFQTMIMELTGMPIANASLLDEATAAAEAMNMAKNLNKKNKSNILLVDQNIFPQTLEVIKSRALPVGIEIKTIDTAKDFEKQTDYFAFITQYPNACGEISDPQFFAKTTANNQAHLIVIADLLSLTLLSPPGEWGADIVVGSSQRFGVPFGFGGPHAAYLATKDEFKRSVPGRIIGVSKDRFGSPALRLALQTREQHIRREKATSNICTAQVLLAVMASMYGVYHGPKGLRKIAHRIHELTGMLKQGFEHIGLTIKNKNYFDTLTIELEGEALENLKSLTIKQNINLCFYYANQVRISLDEKSNLEEVQSLIKTFAAAINQSERLSDLVLKRSIAIPLPIQRSSEFMTQKVFNQFHSETDMLRYIHSLEKKDLSLNQSMIPLGSCTMKLNATTEMIPVTWPEFSGIHPFAPLDQAQGYLELISELNSDLAEITGYAGISVQPNAGSQGEYAGLLVIKKYLEEIGQENRKICLIPSSAHGTNPASAAMAGMTVVVVNCDSEGNIDFTDLKNKVEIHSKELAALMVTYPSTHGVFEESIVEICDLIHQHGGQVYMDGANLNAMVGVAQPGKFGSDVSHLNLHKTFCIPHGGGGPGVGPIGVAEHLKPFLPQHSVVPICGPETGISAISAAPWGSAGILPISWSYCKMMGKQGLKKASQVAILNANYIAKKLSPHFDVLYKGKNGFVAHECIIDFREFKKTAGIAIDDIAKRLMDYGFHAPTMSWPVAGTLMIEPTESESQPELDRFIEAMISIKNEIEKVESGQWPKEDNPLVNAPHPPHEMIEQDWNHPYTPKQAYYPLDWVKENKYWVPVGRVDNPYGDKNLVCSCAPLEDYQSI